MSNASVTDAPVVARAVPPAVPWGLLVGGVLFFVGGSLHPKEDPPGVSVREHMRVMFTDPAWYAAHSVLLAGLTVLALALVVLVRSRSLAGVPRMRVVTGLAAVATCLAAPAMLLHLVAAVDADAIAGHRSTPVTDVQVVVETVTVPLFGLCLALLAVVGAATRTLGNVVTAVPGVLGGLGYALAGATFLATDRFDGLFPAAAGIAVWAVAAGIGLLLRQRTPAS